LKRSYLCSVFVLEKLKNGIEVGLLVANYVVILTSYRIGHRLASYERKNDLIMIITKTTEPPYWRTTLIYTVKYSACLLYEYRQICCGFIKLASMGAVASLIASVVRY
jgi:hypothetical protein